MGYHCVRISQIRDCHQLQCVCSRFFHFLAAVCHVIKKRYHVVITNGLVSLSIDPLLHTEQMCLKITVMVDTTAQDKGFKFL